MTKDIYYPFETNMLCDERVVQLIETHGMNGLGIYTLLLTELRKRDHYTCGTATLRFLSRAYQINPDILNSVINDFDLFECHGEDENILISSPYLNRVMEKFDTANSAKNAPQKSRTSTARSTASITANRADNGRFTVTDRPIKEKKTKENTTTTDSSTPVVPSDSVQALPPPEGKKTAAGADRRGAISDNPYRPANHHIRMRVPCETMRISTGCSFKQARSRGRPNAYSKRTECLWHPG